MTASLPKIQNSTQILSLAEDVDDGTKSGILATVKAVLTDADQVMQAPGVA